MIIKWHVPSERKRHLTNTSIGYINGVEVYNIVYARESTKDYMLYRSGFYIGRYSNINHAIRGAESLEQKRKNHAYRS